MDTVSLQVKFRGTVVPTGLHWLEETTLSISNLTSYDVK